MPRTENWNNDKLKMVNVILFTDDCNGHEFENPPSQLIEFKNKVQPRVIKTIEYGQLGATRMGGSLKTLLEDLECLSVEYKVLKSGYWVDFKPENYEIHYEIISGNY